MRIVRAGLGLLWASLLVGAAGLVTGAPPVTDANELFARLDRNGDHRVEAAEIVAEHARLFRLLLATADQDHDGALSRQEWTAGLKVSRPEPALEKLPEPPTPAEIARAMFRRYDGDRNQRLELKELPPRQQRVFRKLLATHDKDHDGALNFQEFEGSYAQLVKESAAMPVINGNPPGAAKMQRAQLKSRLQRLDDKLDKNSVKPAPAK